MQDQGSERVKREDTYTADRLQVSNASPGAIEIRVGETDVMRVRVSGPEQLVERIQCEVRDDVLHVSGRGHPLMEMTAESTGGWFARTRSMIRLLRGMIRLGIEHAQVVIEVPARTPITIDDSTFAEYMIGDTDGPLDLRLNGSGDATVGRVGATQVTLGSYGSVDIGAVSGQRLHAALMGSGDLRVRGGRVEELDLRTSSYGNAAYHGVAGIATLSTTGSGDIDVRQVTEGADVTLGSYGSVDIDAVNGQRLHAVLMGSGDLRVRGGRVEELALHTSNYGGASYHGVAGIASLSTTGSGDIDVRQITEGANVTLGNYGSVDIDEVSGQRLRAVVQGSGDLRVRGGKVDTLDLRTSNYGSAAYHGVAGTATLSTTGSGDIDVREITESVSEHVGGYGTITIDVRPQTGPGNS